MQVLFPCPSCHKMLQPPLQASGSAKLRCPLCQHELVAYDLVQGAHRAWMVIEDPGGEDLFADFQARPTEETPPHYGHGLHGNRHESHTRHPVSPYPVSIKDSVTSHDGELKLAPEEAHSQEAAEEEHGKPIQWEKFKPITHEEFQRRRRAAKSPIASVLQVVLGGFAAIPVSLLILWYGFGKDVADAGPTVAEYVPWIVPQKFHRNRPSKVERDFSPWDQGDFPNLSKFDVEPTEPKQSEPSEALQPKGKNDSVEPPAKTAPSIVTPPKTPDDKSSALEKQGLEKPMVGDKKASNAEVSVLPPPEDAVGAPPKLPIVSALDQWENAKAAVADYQGDSSEIKKSLNSAYVLAAMEVARQRSTLRFPQDRVWIEKCHQLLQEHARDAAAVKLISVGGPIISEGAEGSGVALVIEVQAVASEDGKLVIQTKDPLKIRDRSWILERPLGPGESESKIGSRYDVGKVMVLGVLSVTDTSSKIVLLDEVPAIGSKGSDTP